MRRENWVVYSLDSTSLCMATGARQLPRPAYCLPPGPCCLLPHWTRHQNKHSSQPDNAAARTCRHASPRPPPLTHPRAEADKPSPSQTLPASPTSPRPHHRLTCSFPNPNLAPIPRKKGRILSR
ncbi:hypothetical protein Pcinc_002035 [Petrolisthes cinctipes]|uniref:Uncharacterized protein n=1 Tax=Petrolisthes cinctipes TaxID=88211 RepID=A0AAE1GIY2_PETCI|nr:hypothetical protein Pcinc_002035 [Petrolisthes cinctipes]